MNLNVTTDNDADQVYPSSPSGQTFAMAEKHKELHKNTQEPQVIAEPEMVSEENNDMLPNTVKEGKFFDIELAQVLQKRNVENKDDRPKKKRRKDKEENIRKNTEKTSNISYIQNQLGRQKFGGKVNPKENNQKLKVGRSIKTYDRSQYNFSNLNRGKALIFNHVQFAKPKTKKRTGTQKDVEYLRLVLEAMGFSVDVFIDLGIEKVKTVLKNYSEIDFSDSDCFFLVAMSHGIKDRLITFDQSLPVDLYWETISKNKSLKGKPKIFIFEMCRIKSSPQSLQIPDLIVSYSTSPGMMSYLLPRSETGGYYIKALCETIAQEYSNTDLESIIQQSQETFLCYIPSRLNTKQIPTHNSTLTKKIYFDDDKLNTDLMAECHENLKKARWRLYKWRLSKLFKGYSL